MAVDDGGGNVYELAIAVARMCAKSLEGLRLVDGVPLHENALGSLRDSPAAEGPFQVLVLGEAAEHDVDGALPVFSLAVSDVGEDAALGRFHDELGVGCVEERDHGARGFPDDLVDQLECMVGTFPEADERDVGSFSSSHGADVFDADLACDDLVSQRGDDGGNKGET